jgi:putative membrane protein
MQDTALRDDQRDRLVLRDHLALGRTTLANERTLLGYVRTALALAVVGASALKFFESPALLVLGWAFLAAGAATLLIGLRRYWRMTRHIRTLRAWK